MLKRIGRLFVIKTRFEALAIIYALAAGAMARAHGYLTERPDASGWLLAAACTVAVFMAGARLLEITRSDNGMRRRKTDFDLPPN